jgi:hypothetical protein
MYSLNLPVSTLRTKIRQEFERHRYVNQMKTVDVLLFNSHQEFQETLNYWKQLSHVLKYFRTEEDPKARLPANFINGFLEVGSQPCQGFCHALHAVLITTHRGATDREFTAWGQGEQDKESVYIALSQYHFLSRAPIRRCHP